ncbi:MAG: hypothetical protein SGI72_17770 [Planctomycetota bacterium]|nr:hypothetical protein [Planctomycetota bacterium]
MKLLAPLALGLVFSVAGCNANPETSTHDHWNLRGVAPSFTRAALGYDAEVNGRYIDYQYKNKKSIYLTAKRHLLNENPENPFQTEDKDFYKPRPLHSILPRPWEYINVEGAAWGGIIAAAGSGVFFPLPIDSLIGTLSEGGSDEFTEGIHRSFQREGHATSASFLHQAIGMEVSAAPLD